MTLILARIVHTHHHERIVEDHKPSDHHDLCRSIRTEQRKQTVLAGTACVRPSGTWPARPPLGVGHVAAGRLSRPRSAQGFFSGFAGSLSFSSSVCHFAASSFSPVASSSCTRRSTASGRRIWPGGGIVFAHGFSPSSPARSSGSASAYFFWPRSAPPSSDFVLKLDQTSGCVFPWMARHSRRCGSASEPLFCVWSSRPIGASRPARGGLSLGSAWRASGSCSWSAARLGVLAFFHNVATLAHNSGKAFGSSAGSLASRRVTEAAQVAVWLPEL